MRGFLMKQSNKINQGEDDGDLLKGLVGGIGDGLKFGIGMGARFLKDTVGKAVPLNKLELEFFALKNGILYWY